MEFIVVVNLFRIFTAPFLDWKQKIALSRNISKLNGAFSCL